MVGIIIITEFAHLIAHFTPFCNDCKHILLNHPFSCIHFKTRLSLNSFALNPIRIPLYKFDWFDGSCMWIDENVRWATFAKYTKWESERTKIKGLKFNHFVHSLHFRKTNPNYYLPIYFERASERVSDRMAATSLTQISMSNTLFSFANR